MPELERAEFREAMERLRKKVEDPAYQAEVARAAAERKEREEREAKSAERSKRIGRLIRERISFPAALEEAVIGDNQLKPTKALQAVDRWLETAADVPAVLVLSGGTGCGKTVAAAWGLVQCGGRWRTAQQLCRLFSASFGEQLEEQEAVTDCRLLVIDDLGTEHDAVRMAETLLEVIDKRQNANRTRTLISTNLSRKDFAARYPSERIASRFAQSAGRVAWVSDKSPDLRTQP